MGTGESCSLWSWYGEKMTKKTRRGYVVRPKENTLVWYCSRAQQAMCGHVYLVVQVAHVGSRCVCIETCMIVLYYPQSRSLAGGNREISATRSSEHTCRFPAKATTLG